MNGNKNIRILLVGMIILLMIGSASASKIQDETFEAIKDLVQPVLDVLVWPVLPCVAGISIVCAAAAPVFGEKGEVAKEKISFSVTWVIIAELILAAFWVIVKLIPIFGGYSAS